MINESIAQLQAQLAEVDDQYLAEQAKNPSGMTGLMAAIEMSKRNKMRSRAAAMTDAYASKDGTVLQETLGQFQAAQAPAPEMNGYADGGKVREFGALDWRDQFNQVPPWQVMFEDYAPPPPRKPMDYGPYEGLGSVGRADLARLNYDRKKNPQSPSPDYDMPAGPRLPPEVGEVGDPYSPYDTFSGLPILSRDRMPTQDPVESGVSDAISIANAAMPSGGGGGGSMIREAVREGNAASAPGTPNFESEYEKLLAGIKSDTPNPLKPPRELDEIDVKRVERLNRAMALGAMAKQFATQNDFYAGFGTGAADASAIMAGGRERLQAEQMDRAKVQSQYDIANSEMLARERLADKSAANNINLSRVEAIRDAGMQENEFANRRDLAQMEIASNERMAAIKNQYDNASRALDFEFRRKMAEMESADAAGLWDKKAQLERELADIQLRSKALDADADRELKRVSIASGSVTDLATALIGQGVAPQDAYLQAREAVFGVPEPQPLPTVKRLPK